MHEKREYYLRLRRKAKRFPENAYFAYLDGMAQPDLASTILVEIPSFQDPELLSTMRAALCKAGNPERIHFAVCYQGDDMKELDIVRGTPHTLVTPFKACEAPGLCAARYEAARLYRDEDYVMHVDSHMRFASFWDVALIDQFRRCPKGMNVLTEYPRNYDQWYGEPFYSDVFDQNALTGGRVIGLTRYQLDGIKPRFTGKKAFSGITPKRGYFISGGFLFGPGHMDKDVPPDPGMFFTADEGSIDLRLWTHGYDVYHPGVRCVYHLYDRDAAARRHGMAPVDRFPAKSDAADRNKAGEPARIEQLYDVRDHGIYLDEFGLGDVRRPDLYYDLSGVNFRSRSAQQFAVDGDFDAKDHTPAVIGGILISEAGHPMRGVVTQKALTGRICAIVTAFAAGAELERTVSSLFRNADKPGRVDAVVVAAATEERYLSFRGLPRERIRVIPQSEFLGDGHAFWRGEAHIPRNADFVLYSGQDMYYVPGWDTALAAYQGYCGDSAVISDWCPGLDPFSLPVKPWQGRITAAAGVDRYGQPKVTFGRKIEAERPVRGVFVSPGNLFAPSGIARKVRHDPEMWADTNDGYMTYRYWCAGVDLYHAPLRYCFKDYESARSRGWPARQAAEQAMSRPKMRAHLGLDKNVHVETDPAFRLGTARTVRAFEAFAGLDLAAGRVRRRAVTGGFADDFGLSDADKDLDRAVDGRTWAKAETNA